MRLRTFTAGVIAAAMGLLLIAPAASAQSTKHGGTDVPVIPYEQWFTRICFVPPTNTSTPADICISRSTAGVLQVEDATGATGGQSALATLLANKTQIGATAAIQNLYGSGAPTNGTSGTGAGSAGPGSLYTRTSNGAVYANTNTKASPTWSQLGSVSALSSAHIFVGNGSNVGTDVALSGDASLANTGALTVTGLNGAATATTGTEANVVHSVTAGTVAASKAAVVDANKAVDTLRATTDRSLGGTGVAGAANVNYETVKEVTGIADASATTVLTITVPNGAHAAMFEIDVIGRLGAGGAIGADEAVSSSKYQGTCVRTAGVASVCTLSSQLGAVNVAVAGAATVTATLSAVANGEGVGATNTHSIKVTITRSGGSSTNHKCDVHVRLHNANASGITVN